MSASLFTCPSTPPDILISSGLSILSLLYKSDNSLDTTRANMFLQKSSLHNELCDIDRYPPTETAAKLHIQRIFLQVCTWKGINLNPLEWGFFMKDDKMLPIMTALDVAPAAVLGKLKCTCRTTCTKRCSCRCNYGINCSNNCRNCKYTCLNKPIVEDNEPCLDELLLNILY